VSTIDDNSKGQAETFVLIVGGGPVGLCLAHILEEYRVPWVLLEQLQAPEAHSRAIGVAPPSQEIFTRIGVLAQIEESGIRIKRAAIHGARPPAIALDFEQLNEPPACIISIPQVQTESILRESLNSKAPHRLWFGAHVRSVSLTGSGVVVDAERDGEITQFTARYLCGCDGVKSLVRSTLIGLGRDCLYPERFVMGDFEDHSGLGDEAHLYFTSHGSVEAFPLPGGIRRWIVQTERFHSQPPAGLLTSLVADRCAHRLDGRHCSWQSSFRIRRSFALAMAKPPVFLAGDAAHTVPPIGGQGMNLGIGDAEHLGDLLGHAYQSGELPDLRAAGYERRRIKAAMHAGLLSLAGMRVGTLRGPIAAPARDRLLRLLLKTRLTNRFMREFAMLSAPYPRSPWKPSRPRLSKSDDRKHSAE